MSKATHRSRPTDFDWGADEREMGITFIRETLTGFWAQDDCDASTNNVAHLRQSNRKRSIMIAINKSKPQGTSSFTSTGCPFNVHFFKQVSKQRL